MSEQPRRYENGSPSPLEHGAVFELHRSNLVSIEEAQARTLANEAFSTPTEEKTQSASDNEKEATCVSAAGANLAVIRQNTLSSDYQLAA